MATYTLTLITEDEDIAESLLDDAADRILNGLSDTGQNGTVEISDEVMSIRLDHV